MKKEYNIGKIKTANFVIYNNGDKKIPKRLGTIPTFPELFIGRKNEVETVHQLLTTQQNILLLVNGKGGIGKTTLASKYYYQYQDYYQHLVWVFSGTSIVDAILTLKIPLGIEFPPNATADKQFNILLQTMAELNRPCLLIIDNANDLTDIETYHNRLLSCTNFHILLTTRVNKEILNTQFHKVKPLEKEEALLIFKKHYEAHDSEEDELFFNLFEKVDQNTLVVELLAKNLSNFNNRLKKRYTLSDLLTDIDKNLLDLSKSKKIGTFYQAKDGILRSETPENIIKAMYKLVKLSKEEQLILAIFSVLPAESIPYGRLETLVPHESLDEILIGLFEKGWLEYDENSGSFRISPVIQEVVREKNDNLYNACEELISQLINKLDYDGTHLTGSTYAEAAILVRYAESIVANLEDLENSISILCERIGSFYNITGNLNKALEFFEIRSLLGKELYESYPNNVSFKNGLAISYAKLAQYYQAMNNNIKAVENFKNAEVLWEELVIQAPQYVQFQHFLGMVKNILKRLG